MSWETVRLGDYVKIKTGKLDANASSENGIYPFFTCSQEPRSINSFSYDCECVLVAGNGDLNVKYFEGKFDAYQRTYIIESKNKELIDVRYLFYFMNDYVSQLREQAIGGVIKYIKLENLTDVKIPLPSIEAQLRVAEILDIADALQRKDQQLVAKYDELAQAIFIDMFGDPFSLPTNSSTVAFEDLTTRITYGFTRPMQHFKDGIPILTAKNVKNGYIDYINVHYASREEFNILTAKCKPEIGDILITKDGTIGRTALFDLDLEICINQSVTLVKPNRNLVEPLFMVSYLNLRSVQNKFQEMGKGGGIKHLQITELAKFPVNLPSLDNQRKFVKYLNNINIGQAIQSNLQSKTHNLFDSLLQKAFKGELDVVEEKIK